MLSNAYFLAKFRLDTAENEPAKNLQKFPKFANFADPNPLTPTQIRSDGAGLGSGLPRGIGADACLRTLPANRAADGYCTDVQ